MSTIMRTDLYNTQRNNRSYVICHIYYINHIKYSDVYVHKYKMHIKILYKIFYSLPL